MKPIYALVDSNNFFVSCVRVFRPDLEGKPVVALSSNDGCVVARSNEAKALGVPMGAPAFKWRQFFKDHAVVQVSGNFELYGDISRRITSILSTITPHIELYSVDESFLDLSELPITDYTAWGQEIRARILRWTGIPVSIGIAPSKTLAKLASDRAKKEPQLAGVLDLASLSTVHRKPYLERLPIQDVWGVGRRLAPRLRAEGIANAWQLASTREQLAQAWMGIHGRQMVRELNGYACLPLMQESKPAKSIANTRTFGQDTNQLHVLEAAIASFAAKTTWRLRSGRQLARRAGLFIATNRHKPGYRMVSREIQLPYPSADTGFITAKLVQTLADMFNPACQYHRAGVWLQDFVPDSGLQIDILGTIDLASHDTSTNRMRALDSINHRYGKRSLYYAAEDLGRGWQPIRQIQMPRWTTRWDELPTAKLV
ncbi:Y-family DNA polymerase [Candidatus Saccharibacteria bacterium]|nr:Y-family DNA polymerase [Candidatus Saccharibacteria bacterium]